METNKRYVCIIVAIAMIICMMPTMVFAEGSDTKWEHLYNAMNPEEIEYGDDYSVPDVIGYTTAPAVGGKYTTKCSIRLLTNVAFVLGTDNVTLSVPEGMDVTINLNGYKIDRGLSGQDATTDGYVIKVESGASLTITDTSGGGIITGGNNTDNGGGVYVEANGTFTMLGGTIMGNAAQKGGGVNNEGTFIMSGGAITGNTAENGGGIYSPAENAISILNDGIVTGNIATTGGGLYYMKVECFAAGTLITMADGTRKAIETLGIDDLVRAFDHETGKVSSAKLYDFGKYPEKHDNVVTLHFTNSIDVNIVYGHSFFEKEQNKYISITKDNVETYIGHEFYNVDDARFEKLIGYDFVDGAVDTYTITTEYYLNCVANGMLSNEDGLYTTLINIFEYGEGLKIDADKKASDIEKYGLWNFKNLKYASKETYDVLNLQYLNVAFGKGMITPEEFARIEAYWTGVYPEIYCNAETKETKKTPGLFAMPLMALKSEGPITVPPEDGVYVGGSIKIFENEGGNLYLSSGKVITIGTGINGVATPTDMYIGVTTEDVPKVSTPVAFINNCDTDDAKYFFSDNSDYCVGYENGVLKLGCVYPLCVGDVQVTSFNKSDILGETDGDGATVSYDNATRTLTLNNAKIATDAAGESNEIIEIYGIYSSLNDYDLTIEIKGVGNQIGKILTKDTDLMIDDFSIGTGIYGVQNITLTGDGTLTIYDYCQGIYANTITFDEGFTGKLNIYDYGYQEASEPMPPACTISAGEDVIISGGSFDLISYNSNGINAAYGIYINDCEEIKVKSCTDGGMAISAENSLTIADTLEITNADVRTTKVLTGKDGGYLTIKPKQVPAPVYYGGDVTYYDVVTSSGVNGTIDVDKKSASYGSTVTVTVTPEKGFALETLTVLDKNGKEIEVKDTKEKNKYTFRMPSSKVTVNATFMEDNTILNYCVDVKKERYYYEPVLWSYENEICKGTDELHFSPNKTLTRAEAVTFFWRIAGEPVVNYAMNYKDVESSRYYTEAVRWAASEKIANGYSDTQFGVTDLVTREQLATMIYRYVQKKGEGFTGSWMFLLPYEDRGKISDWANEAAHWCSMKGVINGKDGNLFDPQGTATRAEAITMLYRFDGLMK